jgi:hypothetical protein
MVETTTLACGRILVSAVAVGCATLIIAPSAFAGPPYVTDDPEPVPYGHWELYLASLVEHDDHGWTGTSPHVEVNYGAIQDVQLHAIVPLAFAAPNGKRSRFGLGDTELGVKWRFIHETDAAPQVGTFPFLELPTGIAHRGLGNGAAQVFLPLWIQKSIGRWTTYGGAGAWLNGATGTRTWWYFGWLVQRRLFEQLSVGAEVFYETAKVPNSEAEARFNLGFVLDLAEQHHVIGSCGRGFVGPNLFQGYLAWLVTLGS